MPARASGVARSICAFASSDLPCSGHSTAPGATNTTNTEYFVSSLDFTNTVDNRLVVWGLTGTNNLATATLTKSVVDTEDYGAPPQAQQKAGPYPLGTALKEHQELVASNDDRLQQVVYAAGKLWTSLTTSAKTGNGPVRSAAAYFILHPSVSGGQVSATVVNQGYVSINGPNQDNVIFPSIAVNKYGKAVMGFSVVGTDFFPSAGYAVIDASTGAGPIHIVGAGYLPEDGFTGYLAYGGARVARWGDYSAAVADESGNLWVANEYIPNASRIGPTGALLIANWGTYITKVTP